MKIKSHLAVLGGLLLLGLLSPLIIIPTLRAQSESRLAQVQADFKAIEKACRSYYIDVSFPFPLDTSQRRAQDPALPLTFEWDRAYWQDRTRPGGYTPSLLTTPIAYLPRVPRDPFASGASYGYFTVGRGPGLAILHSVGPDGKPNLDLPDTRQLFQKILELSTPPSNQSIHPLAWGAICQMIDRNQYDPTNGASSQGDLFALLGGSGEIVYQSGKKVPPFDTIQLSRFPFSLDPPALAPGWTVDDPIPPPASFLEEVWATWRPPLTFPIRSDLTRAGFFEARYDNASHREIITFKPEKLAACRVRLAPFKTFFEHPAALTPAQSAALDAWSGIDFNLWQALLQAARFRSRYTTPDSPAPPTITGPELYPALLLYGKCRLLLAASLASTIDADLARSEADAVHNIAMKLKDARKGKPYPHYEQIENELERMSTELATWLATQKP